MKELNQEIPEAATSLVNPKLKRWQIKNKAADMVVGIDRDNIEEFNPKSSRKNKILNRVYRRYKRKYDDDKFANLSLKEIRNLSPKEQERWFALTKNKTAAPVLGGIATVIGAPLALEGFVVAPLATTLGFVGSGLLGKKGADYGRKIDERRHGLTNNEEMAGLIGGTVGGLASLAPAVAKYRWNSFKTQWNSGRKVRQNYSNWGGEFVDDVPYSVTPDGHEYNIIDKAFDSGKLKWGNPVVLRAYHQSDTPIKEFTFPFERWDVKNHGADPNSAFLTGNGPAKTGFLSKRPYTSEFEVSLKKPLIQTGEIHGVTKNGIRNKIAQVAREGGADGVIYNGILDNQVPEPQQIIQAFDTSDISFVAGNGTPPNNVQHSFVVPDLEIMIDPKALRQTLKTKINPVLKRNGIKTIPLNSDYNTARQSLISSLEEARTVARGVRLTPGDSKLLKSMAEEGVSQDLLKKLRMPN